MGRMTTKSYTLKECEIVLPNNDRLIINCSIIIIDIFGLLFYDYICVRRTEKLIKRSSGTVTSYASSVAIIAPSSSSSSGACNCPFFFAPEYPDLSTLPA